MFYEKLQLTQIYRLLLDLTIIELIEIYLTWLETININHKAYRGK